MKTSFKTATLALVASILVTTTMVHLIANYAHADEPARVLAAATPRT